jgi:hypothetical protein
VKVGGETRLVPNFPSFRAVDVSPQLFRDGWDRDAGDGCPGWLGSVRGEPDMSRNAF